MAARTIQHKFLRLFFPELPETPDDQELVHSFYFLFPSREQQETRISFHSNTFPTAYQVATMDLTTLRTAGLSGRKAEYGAPFFAGRVC